MRVPMFLFILILLPIGTISFTSTASHARRPLLSIAHRCGAHQQAAGAVASTSPSSSDNDDGGGLNTTERTLLLDEIDDLTRSFEAVQRTISINKEVYEERVRLLTSRLEEAEAERDELRLRLGGSAGEGTQGEGASIGDQREALRRQLADAKAESARERDRLRAEVGRCRERIASLEAKSEELGREGGDGGGSWDDLVRERDELTDEVVRIKMSFASEKSALQADFGSILRDKDEQINELQEKVSAYERDRSSLRKLTGLGLRRIFRLGR